MEKQFKKIHGQQFFFVSLLIFWYLSIMLLTLLPLLSYFHGSPGEFAKTLPETMMTLGILALILIPLFAVIALIIFAVSRIWAEPYATLTDRYLMIKDEKIFYFEIEKIEFIPGSWLGRGRHSFPYGPASVHLYCKDKRYTRFLDEDFVKIQGISYRFFLALKKKCPNATVRYKYFAAIFLIVPLCIAVGSALLGLIPEEYL